MGLGGGLDSLMKKRGSEVVMTSHGLDLDLGTFVPGGVAGGFLGKLDFSRDRDASSQHNIYNGSSLLPSGVSSEVPVPLAM